MMKQLISMLLALMLLMLGMATAEDAADDAWEYELVGRAIELVRQMDAQERGGCLRTRSILQRWQVQKRRSRLTVECLSRRLSASTARTSRRRCCFLR